MWITIDDPNLIKKETIEDIDDVYAVIEGKDENLKVGNNNENQVPAVGEDTLQHYQYMLIYDKNMKKFRSEDEAISALRKLDLPFSFDYTLASEDS